MSNDLQTFVNIYNCQINKIYVDKFWNNIESDSWIYLDEELIQWFGHKELSKGKEKLVNLLKKYHEIDEEYKILNNDEYMNLIKNNKLGYKFRRQHSAGNFVMDFYLDDLKG